MPIALDPQETVWLWLQVDAAKPEDARPAFQVRYMTVAQRRRLIAAAKDAAGQPDDQAEETIRKALESVVVGWRGFPKPYALDLLPEYLTVAEYFELVGECLRRTELSEIDRKKSASPSESVGAQPVNAAPAAGA